MDGTSFQKRYVWMLHSSVKGAFVGKLGARKSHPKMLFLTKLYKGRYQDLGTFDRRKVRKIHLMNCRLAVQLFGVALRALEKTPVRTESIGTQNRVCGY
jgi:hypothetical protein